ncbi:histamine H2 receptor-like [Oculina patagonica]
MNSTEKNNNGSVKHHSYNEDDSTPGTIHIINCVLNAPLMLISILGNALVLAAIIRTPHIRSTSMIMLCSLSVSDLLIGFLVQPTSIAEELTKDPVVYHISWIIGPSLCGVSLLTITAISVDRFLALHYHMKYATLVTKSRVKCTLLIIWFFNLLLTGFEFWSIFVHRFLTGVVIIICLIISSFSYIRIYLIVRRHQLQIRAQQQAVQSSNAENNFNVVRLRKSAMNTFVFFIALIICYFPMYIIFTLLGIFNDRWQPEWEFVLTAVYMNSSINPLLYCWRLRELRAAVVKTAKQMLCKQREEN